MIFEVLAALLILLLLYKKRFLKIINIPIRYPLLLFLSFLFQFLIVYLGGREINFILKYGPVIYVGSFLLLLWTLYQNSHIKGMKIIFIGIFLNFIAITMNGGQMPVAETAMQISGLEDLYQTVSSGLYPTHTLMAETDNIISKITGDFIPIPPPHPRPRVISIGDIVMTVGVIYMFYFYISREKLN